MLLIDGNGYNSSQLHCLDENKGSCNSGVTENERNKYNKLADSFSVYDGNSHIFAYFTDNTDSNSMSLKYEVRNNAIDKPSHINGGFRNEKICKNMLYALLVG